MTDADQIAREIAHMHTPNCKGDPHSFACDLRSRAILKALREYGDERHTAGFNEAKGRAVEIVKSLAEVCHAEPKLDTSNSGARALNLAASAIEISCRRALEEGTGR